MDIKSINFPFNINPTEEQIEKAISKVAEIYSELPETTCLSHTACCRSENPNLYLCEAIFLRRQTVDKWDKKDRAALTLECVRRYLYDQHDKDGTRSCVFLKDNKCGIYQARQLKCRLYGLIPDSLYNRNADEVAKESGIPRAEYALCNQCPDVKVKPEFAKRFPDGKVPEKTIRKMEKRMVWIDRGLGATKATEKYFFLTYHDYHLLFEFGEAWMVNLTKLRKNLKKNEKEQFLDSLKSALAAI